MPSRHGAQAHRRRIEMVNSCIVNKAREMFILTFLHTKGDALTVAPPLRP